MKDEQRGARERANHAAWQWMLFRARPLHPGEVSLRTEGMANDKRWRRRHRCEVDLVLLEDGLKVVPIGGSVQEFMLSGFESKKQHIVLPVLNLFDNSEIECETLYGIGSLVVVGGNDCDSCR